MASIFGKGSAAEGKSSEALLLEAIDRLASEMKSMQGILAAHSMGMGGKGHEAGHAHADPHDAAHGHADGHGHGHFSLADNALPLFHIVIDSLNCLGVLVMFVAVIAVLPTLFQDVLPTMFSPAHDEQTHANGHRHQLHVRMTLSKGIMLGLDLMVGADIIETLIGGVDIIKIMCIVAIRSFLGWERGQEMKHMQHEIDHWKKAQKALLKKVAGGVPFYEMSADQLAEKTKECFSKFDADGSGEIDHEELKDAMQLMGVQVSDAEIRKMIGNGKGMSYPQFHMLILRMAGSMDSHEPEPDKKND